MMLSGRHLLLIGLAASAGLVSVHDSQVQVDLGYEVAQTDTKLRQMRADIEIQRVNLRSMQVPEKVIAKAVELRLDVAPTSPLDPYAPPQLEAKQRLTAQKIEKPEKPDSRRPGAANAPGGPSTRTHAGPKTGH